MMSLWTNELFRTCQSLCDIQVPALVPAVGRERHPGPHLSPTPAFTPIAHLERDRHPLEHPAAVALRHPSSAASNDIRPSPPCMEAGAIDAPARPLVPQRSTHPKQ